MCYYFQELKVFTKILLGVKNLTLIILNYLNFALFMRGLQAKFLDLSDLSYNSIRNTLLNHSKFKLDL